MERKIEEERYGKGGERKDVLAAFPVPHWQAWSVRAQPATEIAEVRQGIWGDGLSAGADRARMGSWGSPKVEDVTEETERKVMQSK